ncbi:unnamed protein product [Clonostachys rosea]|uniref:PNPLA domain-containing protein n=1 Tax=Bionectria ochroleuca TaxID=29856 RepID=A0ABY6TUJ4_BIOOC|nr:unnamed protein product [Clonostachys rosea]
MDQQAFVNRLSGDGGPSHFDEKVLCLLALDGGGVRGLSTLYVLKTIMERLNYERKRNRLPAIKPCEVFDIIGGTSTGGKIIPTVFGAKKHKHKSSVTGKIQPMFDSRKLRKAIEQIIVEHLYGITRLRTYSLPEKCNIPVTISQAALATSVATGMFEAVSVGALQFVDGALGANNPVDEVEAGAVNIWCPETGDPKPLIKCFISISTGNPGKKPILDGVYTFLAKTLVRIVTEAEETARRFMERWRQHYDLNRYFRFNVEQGL